MDQSEEIGSYSANDLDKETRSWERDVSEEMKLVDELSEIVYLRGYEDEAGYFPILESMPGNPIKAVYSFGKKAQNFSSARYSRDESENTGSINTRLFLKEHGFSERTIRVAGKFEGLEPQFEEVSRDTLKFKNKAIGNLVFTRDPEISLNIVPADCPTAVIYGKDREGNPFVAIDHGGQDALNAGITRQGLWYLENIIGVDLSTIKIAIYPGNDKKRHFITNEWVNAKGEKMKRGNGIPEKNWGSSISPKKSDDPREKRFVDMTGALIMQAIQAGVDPKNIQAIKLDLYGAAKRGEAFSMRYTLENGGDRPGANIIAVQLVPEKIIELPIAA